MAFIITEGGKAQALIVRLSSAGGAGLHPRDRALPFEAALSCAQLARDGAGFVFMEISPDETTDFMIPQLPGGLPGAVIFEINFSEIQFYRKLILLFRNRAESIVAFGAHAVCDPESLFREGIDYCVAGEAESVLPGLVKWLVSKKPGDAPAGLRWMENGTMKSSGAAPALSSDQLPFAPASFLKADRYHKTGMPIFTGRRLRWGFVLGNRGCPYTCRFCSSVARQTVERTFRPCSPARLVDEMFYQAGECGRNIISIEDDIFTADADWTLEVCELLKRRGWKTPWIMQTRLDCVTEEIAAALAAAGCVGATCGVESGSDAVLAELGKNTTVEEMRRGAAALGRHGIVLRATAMIGMPGETLEDFEKTANLLKELNPLAVQMYFCTAYPDTEYGRGADCGETIDRLEAPTLQKSRIPLELLSGLRTRFYKKFYLSLRYAKSYSTGWIGYIIFNKTRSISLILSFLLFSLRRNPKQEIAGEAEQSKL